MEGRGRPFKDHRRVINGIFWILRSGAPRRDLPARYEPWKTVYDRFRRWAEEGTLDRIARELQRELNAEGKIDWEQFNIDGTRVRASRNPPCHRRLGPAVGTWNTVTNPVGVGQNLYSAAVNYDQTFAALKEGVTAQVDKLRTGDAGTRGEVVGPLHSSEKRHWARKVPAS